jgi:alpha-L-rhamnosidase
MTRSVNASLLYPYALQTEQRTEPLGMGERQPRLSWRLLSDRRGAAQGSYRITAAERPGDLDDPTRLVWDSGRRESADSLLVPWEGQALRTATRYHWRVQVWDETGTPGTTAQTWFETGLLHADDWSAVWVGRDPVVLPAFDPPQDDDPESSGLQSPPLQLRRAFDVYSRPVRVRLYATARGVYEARLNGSRIGDAELAPGWTEYHRRLQYQTYDVTHLVTEGRNVLAAIVADGWWSGYLGFDPRRAAQHYGERPAFLAQLVLDFADGSRHVVATDSEWTEQPGSIRSADLLMGQTVDARRHTLGWDTPNAHSTGFHPVAVLDTEPGPLVPEPDNPIRVTRDMPAIAVHRRGQGRFVVDFGQNMVGRIRLTVRNAEPGRRIVLRHAEVLKDGELYLDNLRRAQATDVYITGGGDTEVFEPQFTVHGFRYAGIDTYPGELEAADVTARVLHNDTPWTGQFACSDPTVNQLQSNIAWGQRGNFLAVPTDCPQRDERLGWLADAQIFAPTASRNADVSAFFARWMRDVRDGQDPDGAFRDVAPVVTLDREAAPAWGDAGVIIPWHLWRTYSDLRALELLRRDGGLGGAHPPAQP